VHRARLHLLYLQGMQVQRDEVLRLDAVSDGLVGDVPSRTRAVCLQAHAAGSTIWLGQSNHALRPQTVRCRCRASPLSAKADSPLARPCGTMAGAP
jgi:hypothetical protein